MDYNNVEMLTSLQLDDHYDLYDIFSQSKLATATVIGMSRILKAHHHMVYLLQLVRPSWQETIPLTILL